MRSQLVQIWLMAVSLSLALPAVALARNSEVTEQPEEIPAAPGLYGTGPELVGPTKYWSVNRAQTLPVGRSLLSTTLLLGAMGVAPFFSRTPGVAIGLFGNGLNVRADTAIGDRLELGAGIGVLSSLPWRGRLDVSSKWNLAQEGSSGAQLSISALAGGLAEIDADGLPNFGIQIGLPVTKVFPFNAVNYAILSMQPTWNIGIAGISASGAGGPFNYLGLGLGLDLALTDRGHLVADTQFGLKIGGLQTDSAIGFRYTFSRDMVGDIFLGVGGAGVPFGLGVGGSYRF
ncbi:MAG: hypothetical protein HY692_02250 [Cyanobacteria bacterium NC_groundwater_1444_Ag_S-0.65um_54_12]|nr:hypothetical protein [Cyanobacteria bacterium NC_groundwater_1444_Ag_S-0.65um_54_12]